MMEIVENGYIDWRQETATLVLPPANPAFRTQIYTGEELNQIRVLGMAVVLQKNLANKKGQGAIPRRMKPQCNQALIASAFPDRN